MSYLEIKSGSKVRKVFSPGKYHRRQIKRLFPALASLQDVICNREVVHGFMRGRSIVTNAMAHVGPYEYTLSMDIKDFFPSTTLDKVIESIKENHKKAPGDSAIDFILNRHLWVDKPRGHICKLNLSEIYEKRNGDTKTIAAWKYASEEMIAEQGLPSSPMLANIAAATIDRSIVESLREIILKKCIGFSYTRYADDLSISFSGVEMKDTVTHIVERAVSESGYVLNPKKTVLHSAKAGRRIITGIAVDHEGIYPTRDTRRKLRAAIHNNWTRKARGLGEFCKLKLPSNLRTVEKIKDETAKLLNWIGANATIRRLHAMKIEVLKAVGTDVGEFSNSILQTIEDCIALCNLVGDD